MKRETWVKIRKLCLCGPLWKPWVGHAPIALPRNRVVAWVFHYVDDKCGMTLKEWEDSQ